MEKEEVFVLGQESAGWRRRLQIKTKREAPDQDKEVPLSKRFRAVMQYERHLAIPCSESIGLGQWCHDQRRAFRAKTPSVKRSQKLWEAGVDSTTKHCVTMFLLRRGFQC
jgi:hypothetical protein